MQTGLLRFNNTLLTPPKWYVYTVSYNGIGSQGIELNSEEQNICNEHYDFFNNNGIGLEVEYEIKMSDSGENYATTNIRNMIKDSDKITKEAVNHPNHYGGESNVYEVIKVCEAWGLDYDAYLFNVVKYVARAGKKVKEKEIEDLKKAAFYLDRKIKKLENESDSTK
jgi:hypothetical protein